MFTSHLHRARSIYPHAVIADNHIIPRELGLTSSKCNGERPVCKACRDRIQPCEYTSEPGISPIASLKRKYESLQAESAQEHDLLSLLRTASEGDAIKMLAYLRSSDDVQTTLSQARSILDTPDELTASPPRWPADQVNSQSDLQATSGKAHAPSIYPELIESDGGLPWALPIEPYVRCSIPLDGS